MTLPLNLKAEEREREAFKTPNFTESTPIYSENPRIKHHIHVTSTHLGRHLDET